MITSQLAVRITAAGNAGKTTGLLSWLSIFNGEPSTRLRLPEINLHVKFFFKEFRAAARVAQVFRGISSCVHLQANRASLKGSADFQYALPMRVIERLRNS